MPSSTTTAQAIPVCAHCWCGIYYYPDENRVASHLATYPGYVGAYTAGRARYQSVEAMPYGVAPPGRTAHPPRGAPCEICGGTPAPRFSGSAAPDSGMRGMGASAWVMATGMVSAQTAATEELRRLSSQLRTQVHNASVQDTAEGYSRALRISDLLATRLMERRSALIENTETDGS